MNNMTVQEVLLDLEHDRPDLYGALRCTPTILGEAAYISAYWCDLAEYADAEEGVARAATRRIWQYLTGEL